MSPPVFISYARSTASAQAEALRARLDREPGTAFLDASNIGLAERIPHAVVDALLNARVVVVLADATYFTRWYCVREFDTSLTLLDDDADDDSALGHIIVALPEDGAPPDLFDHLPAELRSRNWPTAGQTDPLADLVRTALRKNRNSIGDRLRAQQRLDQVRTTLLEAAAIPPVRGLGGVPVYALDGALPVSIGDAFVGRADELWRLHHALFTMQSGQTGLGSSVALLAGGGFGKTTLAAEYLRRVGPLAYSGGLFWINAAVPERREEQLHGVLRELDPDVPDLAAFRESRRDLSADLARALRNTSADRAVLYVLDNLPETPPDQPPQPLRDWCPALGDVALVITSRVMQAEPGVVSLPIDVLAPAAAVQILARGTEHGSALTSPEWMRIADWVGCLPLALELIAGTVRYGLVSPSDLLARAAADTPLPHLEAGFEALETVVPAGSLRGIAEAFEISYQTLPEEAQGAARLLAQLAPQPIPRRLLDVLAIPPTSLAALTARSIIAPAPEVPAPVVGRMHGVLAEFLRTKGAVEGEADLVALALTIETQLDPATVADAKQWPLLSLYIPHARWLRSRLSRECPPHWPTASVALGRALGRLLLAQGLLSPALEALEDAVAIGEGMLGDEARLTAEAIEALAVALTEMGELIRARDIQQRAVMLASQHGGPEHSLTLNVQLNLADTLRHLGDLRGARALQTRVLDTRRRRLGDGDPATLTAMANLAVTCRWQGDYGGAADLQTQVLSASIEAYGEEHRETIIALDNLAVTVSARGDIYRAMALQIRAARLALRLLSEQHPDTLKTMGNLASTIGTAARQTPSFGLLLMQRDSSRPHASLTVSRLLQERVVNGCRRLFGDDHPSTLRALGNLADYLFGQHEFQRARELEEQVLRRKHEILGDRHPDTLTAVHNLAISMARMGEYDAALAKLESNLANRLNELGDGHPDVRQSERVLNELRSAIATGDAESLIVHSPAPDEEALAGAQMQEQLAHEVLATGNQLAAAGEFEGSIATTWRVLGGDHPITLNLMGLLAGVLFRRGQLFCARIVLEHVVSVQRRRSDDNDPETLTSMHNLALTLRDDGDPDTARTMLEEVLHNRRVVLGPEHDLTLTTAWVLRGCLLALGDQDAADTVVSHDLQWLLSRSPDALTETQQHFRTELQAAMTG